MQEHEEPQQDGELGGDDAFGGGVGNDLPGRDANKASDAGAGQATEADGAGAEGAEAQGTEAQDGAVTDEAATPGDATETDGEVSADAALAAERLEDLRRMQAEFVNYKRRVERDRERQRETAISAVVEALLPVLDDIFMARQHGELEGGPFEAIAAKLEATLERFDVVRVGEAGEPFDPTLHEALMHVEAELPEGAEGTTIVQVMQPGYKVGDRVVRPARVSVADPA